MGLIAAHLLRASVVIGEDPGGGRSLRGLAPFHLWRTGATEEFLTSLGVAWRAEVAEFGFWTERGISASLLPWERDAYLSRSRGRTVTSESAACSGLPGVLLTFDRTVDDLTHALLSRVPNLREGRVEAVLPRSDAIHVHLRGGDVYRADAVVNTLPRPVFDALLPADCARGGLCPSGPKCFVRGAAFHPDLASWMWRRRWLYVTHPAIPFDRVTRVSDFEFSYEFNSSPPDFFSDCVCGSCVLSVPRVQVLGEPRSEFEFDGRVRHVGRMARWDHGIRLHNVIEDLLPHPG